MAEGRARNMKGREETPEKEEQGTLVTFRPHCYLYDCKLLL